MSLTKDALEGIIAAIPTPFSDNDEVDEDSLRRLVDFVINGGVHAIMTTGGNGEFPHLLASEREKVLEVTLDQTSKRIPVIACTTTCSTKHTISLTKHAEEVGADAAIIVPPYYFAVPDQSLYEYYSTICENTELPVVVYNNPGYTQHNITPALMERITGIESVIGLKQSNYDISQTLEIIRHVGEKISVLTGIDSQLFPVLSLGGRGVFSTAASVIPEKMVEIFEAFKSGDFERAKDLQIKLQVLNSFFEYDPGYVAPCKEALAIRGLPVGKPRSPLPLLRQKERKQIEEALKTLGVVQ